MSKPLISDEEVIATLGVDPTQSWGGQVACARELLALQRQRIAERLRAELKWLELPEKGEPQSCCDAAAERVMLAAIRIVEQSDGESAK